MASALDISYQFKLISVDMDQSTMVIEFDPLDDDCTPITLNTQMYMADLADHPSYTNREDIPLVEHLKKTASVIAPRAQWATQKYMVLKNSDINSQITANTFITT